MKKTYSISFCLVANNFLVLFVLFCSSFFSQSFVYLNSSLIGIKHNTKMKTHKCKRLDCGQLHAFISSFKRGLRLISSKEILQLNTVSIFVSFSLLYTLTQTHNPLLHFLSCNNFILRPSSCLCSLLFHKRIQNNE